MMIFLVPENLYAQSSGGIRGVVYDSDFDAPLGLAEISVVETGQKVQTAEEGNYVISGLEPGTYTLVVSKEGYTRKVFADVVVPSGQMADQNAQLSGEFTDMEEFVVQDLNMGGASEEGLLNLRMEAPALMDSVGADLISQSGASDAASALKLVAGATVQDGKYAVVRGLPDRYVVSLLNGVRLPTADPDKRAVQLDQYPSSLIESVQVSKTFTPDQQGDASGGAVNIVLRGIPDERLFKVSIGSKYNESYGGERFRTFDPIDPVDSSYLGKRDFSPPEDSPDPASPEPQTIEGSYGSHTAKQPFNYNWGLELGDRHQVNLWGEELSIGGVAAFNYEQSASFRDDEIRDRYGITGDGVMVPTGVAESPEDNATSLTLSDLWDITKSTDEIAWNGAVGVGVEHELFKLNYLNVLTHNREDTSVFAEDTRGRNTYNSNYVDYVDLSTDQLRNVSKNYLPYQRSETLLHRERDTGSGQFSGELTIPIPDMDLKMVTLNRPVFDFNISDNRSAMSEQKEILEYAWTPPELEKSFDPNYDWRAGIDDPEDPFTMFDPSAAWLNPYTNPDTGEVTLPKELPQSFYDDYSWLTYYGFTLPDEGLYNAVLNPTGPRPSTIDGVGTNSFYIPVFPGEQLGNYQMIWKRVVEQSEQEAYNLKWDFDNWTSNKGFLKTGVFKDHVDRSYFQQTLSNKQKGVTPPAIGGEWEDSFSSLYPSAGNTNVYSSAGDISYDGEQQLNAWYWMLELPMFDSLTLRGGARYETFSLKTYLKPDDFLTAEKIYPSGTVGLLTPTGTGYEEDADYSRSDVLPSIGFDFNPVDNVTFRVNWAKTVAKQQFKEITPVVQQEYAGGDAFYGNSDLQASPVDNFDVRLDYTPYAGGLVSVSYFKKDIEDPIQYYQGSDDYGRVYTFVTNYPSAWVEGWEVEVRQSLGQFWDSLDGMNIGANYTMIQGEVDLGDGTKSDVREMPDELYNLFWTYDLDYRDIKMGVFYSYTGEKLQTARPDEGVIPAVYSLPHATVNASLSFSLTDRWSFSFKAKNLLNPEIQSVYREEGYEDAVRTSYTSGRSYSVSLKYSF